MAVNSAGTKFMFGTGTGRLAVGSLTSIGEITPGSEDIDITTLDSPGGYRQYMQGCRDAGILAVEGFLDSGDAGQSALRNAYDSGAQESCSIVFPDGSKVEFVAYVKSYAIGAAKVDGAVGFSAKLRITGAVTYTGK